MSQQYLDFKFDRSSRVCRAETHLDVHINLNDLLSFLTEGDFAMLELVETCDLAKSTGAYQWIIQRDDIGNIELMSGILTLVIVIESDFAKKLLAGKLASVDEPDDDSIDYSNTLLNHNLLVRYGFTFERCYREQEKNFTIKYSIDGFDGQIDLYAQFHAPGFLSPEEQVEEGSSIDYLIEGSTSTYHVYGGDFHITTIDTHEELMNLFRFMRRPLREGEEE